MEEMRKEWSDAQARSEAMLEREVLRRQAICKQVVGRIWRGELAAALARMREAVQIGQEERARGRRVIMRMRRHKLAMAFDSFRCKVQERRRGKVAVGRALGRWRAPTLVMALTFVGSAGFAVSVAARAELARPLFSILAFRLSAQIAMTIGTGSVRAPRIATLPCPALPPAPTPPSRGVAVAAVAAGPYDNPERHARVHLQPDA